MLWLLKKDWRLNRAPVVGSLIISAASYLIFTLWMLTTVDLQNRRGYNDAMMLATYAGSALTAIMAAVFGGTAFALERRESSANFLALLPIHRVGIVASKAIVAISWLMLLWTVNISMVAAGFAWVKYNGGAVDAFNRQYNECSQVLMCFAIASTALFGLAWLFSTFLTSPAIAASISMGIIVAAVILAILAADGLKVSLKTLLLFFHAASIVAAISSFLAGTIYYLRRVEP